MKFSKKIQTSSYYINRFGKLSTSFMFYQMQDIAWEHANLLELGYDHLKKNKQFWVLARLLVQIDRRPEWGEEFILETWSRGTDGFFAYRDYSFIDKNNNTITRGTSSWLILDLKSKRIVRLSNFKKFPRFEESALGRNTEKIQSPQNETPLVFTPVLFNEIDINQHFNTGRYLERIIDAYDFEFHEKHELKELEVNFMKEGMPEDKLAVKKEFINGKNHLCSVVRKSDGNDLIRARLGWANR